jgi:hypothetical protein
MSPPPVRVKMNASSRPFGEYIGRPVRRGAGHQQPRVAARRGDRPDVSARRKGRFPGPSGEMPGSAYENAGVAAVVGFWPVVLAMKRKNSQGNRQAAEDGRELHAHGGRVTEPVTARCEFS